MADFPLGSFPQVICLGQPQRDLRIDSTRVPAPGEIDKMASIHL